MKREYLSWGDYDQGVAFLCSEVQKSGFDADIILGVSRGGLVPCASFGYYLENKNIYIINVEFYTADNERLETPVILPPYLEMTDLENYNVLIVDEIADTGKTLAKVKEFCEAKVKDVRTAVLYEKSWSEIKCDFVWRRSDRWIEFPWYPPQ